MFNLDLINRLSDAALSETTTINGWNVHGRLLLTRQVLAHLPSKLQNFCLACCEKARSGVSLDELKEEFGEIMVSLVPPEYFK